eukprot:10849822-Lingulodinium_polyedra.AAC.1
MAIHGQLANAWPTHGHLVGHCAPAAWSRRVHCVAVCEQLLNKPRATHDQFLNWAAAERPSKPSWKCWR